MTGQMEADSIAARLLREGKTEEAQVWALIAIANAIASPGIPTTWEVSE